MPDTASGAVEKHGIISRKHVVTWGQFNPGPPVDKLAACCRSSVVGTEHPGTAGELPPKYSRRVKILT
jgi:hypothetical protein